ncbi:MAG: hypothetical protein P4L59_13270 [Desulfosporosinus sp.]|nr:hypothetical protein [Desulfosporosinus sp.]
MNNEYVKRAENAYSLITQANNDMISLWLTHTFLTWQWWFGVSLTIVPWVLWILFRKNESTNRLLFVGFFVMLISSWLDLMGILFGLWSYYRNVVPFSPAFIPWDFTLLPVTIMFLLQIKPKISPLIKAITFSVFSSFMAEPFFVWIGTYNPKHWRHIYSFPIFIAIYLVSDWISKGVHFEKL